MSAAENPPAFPGGFTGDTGFIDGGMTLRDWFAGQALVGMGMWMPPGFVSANTANAHAARAGFAYALADAMLAERERAP